MKLEEAAARKLRGPEFKVCVERGKIREFAAAVGSAHPAHLGDETPVAPAYFLVTAGFFWGYTLENPGDTVFADVDIDRSLLLHAGEEVEFTGQPPRAGDILSAQVAIVESYTRESSRSGAMTFVTTETEFRDANSELVARQRTTLVHVPPSSGQQAEPQGGQKGRQGT